MTAVEWGQAIDRWQAEEDRRWQAFQVPQAAYHAAADGATMGLAGDDLDGLLHAAVKMGEAARRVLHARTQAAEARRRWLELAREG